MIVEGLFEPQDVAALQVTVENFKRQGLLYDQSVTHLQNFQLHDISACSALCRALPFKEEVRQCLTTLLGGDKDPLEIMGDQMFLKPAHTGQGTSFHQDNAYFRRPHPELARGTGMWVAVHDANEENGTIRVIPGSHRYLLAHARDSISNHFISCEDDPWMVERRGSGAEVAAVMPAGGVCFFSYGTAHGTGDNVSAHERAGLAFHIGPASLHDQPSITYPGSEGEGNQSQAQQDNAVIQILQAKAANQPQEKQAGKQLEMLLDAGDALANPNSDATGETQVGVKGATTTRKWLTGPYASSNQAYGVKVVGSWQQEVQRVLDGSAANDWVDGRNGIGSDEQRAMISASVALSQGTFGRMSSKDLPPRPITEGFGNKAAL